MTPTHLAHSAPHGSTSELPPLPPELHGKLIRPSDETYEALTTAWNLAVNMRPRGVVDAHSPADIAAAVRYARDHGLTVGVLATGHGAVSALVGDILVNTGRLTGVTVDPTGWARVGAGAKWAHVIEHAAPHGLAALNGSSTDVGVVGFVTGGGAGPMSRTFGLASDHVRSFTVVTGDGEQRHASAEEHPELFAALRGGKGAAGIVTEVEIDLVKLASFYGGAIYFDGADARNVIHAWRRWSEELPETANTSFVLFRLPPLDFVPEPLRGRLTIGVRFLWTGAANEGQRLLDQMRTVAPVILDDATVKPYTAIDTVHNDPVDPMPVIDPGGLLHEFDAEAIDTLLKYTGADADCPQVMVEIRQLGGAYARAPQDADSFDHRDARFSLLTIGMAGPGVLEHHQQLMSALNAWDTGGVWPNFGPPHDRRTGQRAYSPGTLKRLADVVRQYDPDRVIAAATYLDAD